MPSLKVLQSMGSQRVGHDWAPEYQKDCIANCGTACTCRGYGGWERDPAGERLNSDSGSWT